jgi:2-dehydropantoate 2-reductase
LVNIGILGAGAIGCYLAAAVATAGLQPVLVGRGRRLASLSAGFVVGGSWGPCGTIEPDRFVLSDDLEALSACDTVLVTVKAHATGEAALGLADAIGPGTVVISVQNGVGNAGVLNEILPNCLIRSGVISFNVTPLGSNRFHRGTRGMLYLEHGEHVAHLAQVLSRGRIAVRLATNINELQWGKLLHNLNNPINALSGLSLRKALLTAHSRNLFADSVGEALRVLRVAGMRPATIGPVPLEFLPHVLRTPDSVFRVLAGPFLGTDEIARTSMAIDLELGRPTEIDALNGVIVKLGRQHSVPTPVNLSLVAAVEKAVARRLEQNSFDDASENLASLQ